MHTKVCTFEDTLEIYNLSPSTDNVAAVTAAIIVSSRRGTRTKEESFSRNFLEKYFLSEETNGPRRMLGGWGREEGGEHRWTQALTRSSSAVPVDEGQGFPSLRCVH